MRKIKGREVAIRHKLHYKPTEKSKQKRHIQFEKMAGREVREWKSVSEPQTELPYSTEVDV